MAAAMASAELPMTRPLVQESDAERLVWTRGINDARDELGLIDAQIESAERIHQTALQEAAAARTRAVEAADRAEARAVDDAVRVKAATIEGLERRKEDLGRKIAGLEAALAATS